MQQIVDGYFSGGLFEQTMDSMNTFIAPHVEADPSAFYDYNAYRAAISELKKVGLLRAESIKGQLDGSIPSTSEGQRADSNKLIDASGVNLFALGSMSGGMGGRGNADRGEGGFGVSLAFLRRITDGDAVYSKRQQIAARMREG